MWLVRTNPRLRAPLGRNRSLQKSSIETPVEYNAVASCENGRDLEGSHDIRKEMANRDALSTIHVAKVCPFSKKTCIHFL